MSKPTDRTPRTENAGDGGRGAMRRGHQDALMSAYTKQELCIRVHALEAALRSVIAWEPEIDLAAPELGGCLKAMCDARNVLENRKP